MSLLSRFASKPEKPATSAEIDRFNAITELIYSGHSLARFLLNETENGLECICGALYSSYPNQPNHARVCPVDRFMTAVERARKVNLHD